MRISKTRGKTLAHDFYGNKRSVQKRQRQGVQFLQSYDIVWTKSIHKRLIVRVWKHKQGHFKMGCSAVSRFTVHLHEGGNDFDGGDGGGGDDGWGYDAGGNDAGGYDAGGNDAGGYGAGGNDAGGYDVGGNDAGGYDAGGNDAGGNSGGGYDGGGGGGDF
nr:Biomphalaria glabrata glycine-rich cell wall structural protein 1.0-like [Biomphalaria glabrata]